VGKNSESLHISPESLQMLYTSELKYVKGEHVVIYTSGGELHFSDVLELRTLCIDDRIVFIVERPGKKAIIHNSNGIEIGQPSARTSFEVKGG